MGISTYLETLLEDWKKLLAGWASSGALTDAVQQALVLESEPEELKRLVGLWSNGDFSDLPPIVLLPAESMPGAVGAYAISTGTIYLNQDWLQTASHDWAMAVLTEELGHHLDGLLNEVDTPGDEGERFSRELITTDSQRATSLDKIIEDNGYIRAGGQGLVQVEFSELLSSPLMIDITPLDIGDGSGLVYLSTFESGTHLVKAFPNGQIEWQADLENLVINEALPGDGGEVVVLGELAQSAEGNKLGDFTIGTTYAFPNNNRTLFVAMLDAEGKAKWSIPIEPTSSRSVSINNLSLAMSPGGELYVPGTYRGNLTIGEKTLKSTQEPKDGIYSEDGFITKINDGKVEWLKSLGGIGNDYIWSLSETSDGAIVTGTFGGLYAVGSPTSLPNRDQIDSKTYFGTLSLKNLGGRSQYSLYDSDPDWFTAKIDGQGNFFWVDQAYTDYSSGAVKGSALSQAIYTQDGGIFGILRGASIEASRGIAKLDGLGNTQWTIGGLYSNWDGFYKLIEGADGDFYFIGNVASYGANVTLGGISAVGSKSWDIATARITKNGVVEWFRVYGGVDADRFSDAWEVNDGLVIAGATVNEDFLIKYDKEGDLLGLHAGLEAPIGLSSGVVQLSLSISSSSVTEDSTTNLLYTFTRNGPTTSALTVNYTVSGTATLGTDYTGIATLGTTKTVTFLAGSTTATVTVDPTADTAVEASETVAITITAGTGYTIGTTSAVVGTIVNDDISSSASTTLSSGQKNLILTGTSAINGTGNELDNRLTGNSANNVLNGGAGADVMTGGLGNDTYIVDNAGDVVSEGASAGTDTVQSSVTHTLGANVENLVLTGTSAINGTGNGLINRLTGNSANNVLNGGAGADVMVGGLGNDTYIVDNAGDVVSEGASAGTDTVQSSVTHTLGANVENLVLTGTSAINGTGNGLINRLTGNSANNVLNGGAGADVMAGGKGNDTYIVDNAKDVVSEGSGAGTDTVKSSVSHTLGTNVENLVLTGTGAINGTGNALINRLTGNSANNVLNGGAGADVMAGGKGNDTYIVDNAKDVVSEAVDSGTDTVKASISHGLKANVENLILTGTKAINGIGNGLNNRLTGNSANNVLNGGAGADAISGGGGDDNLLGGLGQDKLTGGIGADTFIYKLVTESGPGKTTRDIVTDFKGSEGDRIDLSAIDAFSGQTGNQAFAYIGSNLFSGTRGEVRFASSILQANTGRDKVADMEIQLLGVTSFGSEFIIL